jgi:F-type H+-transporting ATPase subunit beta
MLGMEQLSLEDRNAVARARRLERFLTQPFFTTEQFSGMKGKLVSLKDSLDGCERILRDEFKDYPESALYMIGAIGEAKKPEANQPEPKKPEPKQPEANQPEAKKPEAKQPDAKRTETKKPDEKKPEDQKTDPQPKAATASAHES